MGKWRLWSDDAFVKRFDDDPLRVDPSEMLSDRRFDDVPLRVDPSREGEEGSFADEEYYGVDAFVFVNKAGDRQAVRYQMMPERSSPRRRCSTPIRCFRFWSTSH